MFELITGEETGINRELFKNYFKFQMPTAMVKSLLYSLNDKEKNILLVNMIKSELSDLKNEIIKTSKDEIKNEKPYKIVDIAEKILEFDRQQHGGSLKILTLHQMLSRLPITLAQLKAGNNSEKLKNEIRKLLYSLYRSKKLTKQIYKSLINII